MALSEVCLFRDSPDHGFFLFWLDGSRSSASRVPPTFCARSLNTVSGLLTLFFPSCPGVPLFSGKSTFCFAFRCHPFLFLSGGFFALFQFWPFPLPSLENIFLLELLFPHLKLLYSLSFFFFFLLSLLLVFLILVRDFPCLSSPTRVSFRGEFHKTCPHRMPRRVVGCCVPAVPARSSSFTNSCFGCHHELLSKVGPTSFRLSAADLPFLA